MAIGAVTVAAGLEGLAELHARELPQKDYLCGCFWGALVLRAAGVEGIDQDAVALETETRLPQGDPASFVPTGARPRRDYRVELPLADDPASGGTAAPALARALERLSKGRLVVLPVAGPWSAESVATLVETVGSVAPDTTLLGNVRTGRLWGSRPDPADLLAYVSGGDVQGPGPEWDTGHYLNLVASIRSGERALVLVRDSYPSLGWGGYHLQPPHALAAALERGDGLEGGVLCAASPEDVAAVRAALESGGYELRDWDNGTPFTVKQ